jgi:pimeloyl-ACP methyl ester carboxylesterase
LKFVVVGLTFFTLIFSTVARAQTPGPALKKCGPVVYQFPKDLYPFTARCMDLGYGDYHFFDESSSAPNKGTVLMVHGNPTSSFAYRNVAKSLLKKGYRVIAMDHYGFGESAKPAVDKFGYTPSDHSKLLVDFVDALDLKDVTLLVQDWGGPVGLGMAVRRPERIKNIMVMNTWGWRVTAADEQGPFGPIVRWSLRNKKDAATFVDNGVIISGAALGLSSSYSEPMATEVKNAYLGPFFDPATGKLRSKTVAVPTNRFAISILEDKKMFDTLGDLKPIANKPVTFFFGGNDQLFGALRPNPDGKCAIGKPKVKPNGTYCVDANGAQIHPALDKFKSLWNPKMIKGTEVNPWANHFVQEEAPDRVAAIVDALNTSK